MKNFVVINFLILDEVFDLFFDIEGINEFFKIFCSFGNEINVFVIFYKGEILVDKFLRIFKFEKVNDFFCMLDNSQGMEIMGKSIGGERWMYRQRSRYCCWYMYFYFYCLYGY